MLLTAALTLKRRVWHKLNTSLLVVGLLSDPFPSFYWQRIWLVIEPKALLLIKTLMSLFHLSVLVHCGTEPVYPVAGHWNILMLLITTSLLMSNICCEKGHQKS